MFITILSTTSSGTGVRDQRHWDCNNNGYVRRRGNLGQGNKISPSEDNINVITTFADDVALHKKEKQQKCSAYLNSHFAFINETNCVVINRTIPIPLAIP